MKKLYIFLNNFLKTNDNVIDNNELEILITNSSKILSLNKFKLIPIKLNITVIKTSEIEIISKDVTLAIRLSIALKLNTE